MNDYAENDGVDRYLFLDDIRHPNETFGYTQQSVYLNKKWIIVKNFEEFIQWIIKMACHILSLLTMI